MKNIKMRMNTLRVDKPGLTLAAVLAAIFSAFLLAACSNPFAPASGSGKASLTVSTNLSASRTLVPDFAGSITSYDITLTSLDGFAQRTAAGVTAAHTFIDLEAGGWDVVVNALAGTVIVATGSVSGEEIAAGASASVSVNLAPVAMTGTGNFTLSMRVPADTGIDSLSWRLETADGTLVCDDLVPAVADGQDNMFTATNTVEPAAPHTAAAAGVPAGSYTLVLGFFHGSTPAGSFREAVNIWGGLTSNKWIKADGTLAAERTFVAAEFFDRNTGLAVFRLSGSNLEVDVPATASSTPFNLGLVRTLSLGVQVQAGYLGQALAYRWNAGATSPWISVATDVSAPVSLPSLALISGTNTLELRVTAADRTTIETSTITMTAVSLVTGSSSVAMEMVQVPGGTFQRNATASNISNVGSFLMGRYLVTQEQFMSVMGWTMKGFAFEGDKVPSEDARRPAENLSWYDAADFCNKLSQMEGLEPVYTLTNVSTTTTDAEDPLDTNLRITSAIVTADTTRNGYRLPTWSEMVWMAHTAYNQENPVGTLHAHAAVPISVTPGHAEQTWLLSQASFKEGTSAYNGLWTTLPAGKLLPNALGMYDVFGNVSEWILDRDDGSTPLGGAGATANYSGASSGSNRMYYGGSTALSSTFGPVANLITGVAAGTAPSFKNAYLGFRVARSLTHKVVYQSTGASSGTPPVDAARYLEGSTVTIKDNIENQMRGPVIQDGITQRFLGWSRTAGATAPDSDLTTALLGAASPVNVVMGSTDLVLYPVWTATAAANTADSMNTMIGPAGGWVIKDIGSGSADRWRYLECAPRDQTSGKVWSAVDISPVGINVGEFGHGYGDVMTNRIVNSAGSGDCAAKMCADLVLNGFDDWYLSTPHECTFIYNNLVSIGLGNFSTTVRYWTTAGTGTTAWYAGYDYPNAGFNHANIYQNTAGLKTRAVRAFRSSNQVYSVFYNANGAGTGSVVKDTLAYESGEYATIKDNTGGLAKSGYTFAGWNTLANGTGTHYAIGSVIPVGGGDITLYAQWASLIVSGMNANSAGRWRDGTWFDMTGSNAANMDGSKVLEMKLVSGTLYSVGTYYNTTTTLWHGMVWTNDTQSDRDFGGNGAAVALDYNSNTSTVWVAGRWMTLPGPAFYRTIFDGVTKIDSASSLANQGFLTIAINGNEVWAGGFNAFGAYLEKNTVQIPLAGGSGYSVNSLAINGSTIIAAGHRFTSNINYGIEAVYWRSTDGGASFSSPTTLWTLASGGTNCFAQKVVFNGSTWYVVGTDGVNAVYAVDGGTKIILAGAASTVPGQTASGIAFSNQAIFICGYDGTYIKGIWGFGNPESRSAYLWIDGIRQTLSSSADTSNNGITAANDIIVSP